jgi:tRNA(Ile)-lysidine synthetase-like protein
MHPIDRAIQSLDQSKTYLIAVSFGVDSMVLLDACRRQHVQLAIAYVNYHRRPESDYEQSQLEQYAFTYDLPLYILDVDSLPSGNFQAKARDARYSFFSSLIQKGIAHIVLTAHHLDDHLETALFQQRRGGMYRKLGLEYETSIHQVTIIRPLLNITKDRIYAYQRIHAIPFSEDASNKKLVYARNRLRHELQGWTDEQKQQLLERIDAHNNLYETKKNELLTMTASYRVLIADYVQLDAFSQFLFWVSWLGKQRIHLEVTTSFLARINRYIQSTKPNIVHPLNATWTLYKAYDHFALIDGSWLQPIDRLLHRPESMNHPLFDVQLRQFKGCPYPIVFRYGRAEDSQQLGLVKKSFRRLMIDWKVPLYLRACYPVITNSKNKFVCIPPYSQKTTESNTQWVFFKV